MRILLINKFNYLYSGTERYLFNLKHLLEDRGHQVEVFAMQHPQNQPATFDHLFVPYVDFYNNLNLLGKLKVAQNVIHHSQAASLVSQVLDDFQPDLVHLHNIYHQLSPAILLPIAAAHIPIVQTLHDYKLICPNYLLYTQEKPCTRCRNGRYWQAVRYRCLHGSFSWSVLAALEMTLHKTWQSYEKYVDRFIAPSHFLKQTCENFGISATQLVHIPYPVAIPQGTVATGTDAGYFVYLGRLSAEKGLRTLIQAMQHVPEARLCLVGDGDMRAALETLSAKLGLTNVSFRGYLKGQDLAYTLAGARFTVSPSEWYENFPYAILESFAAGKAAIGSDIGGIPELIDEGETGRTFPAGDVSALADRIRELWHHPKQTWQMGQRGREKVLANYSPEKHYEQLLPLYQGLIPS